MYNNKALESCKINGLLFLSLDANEHFHSRSRCCPTCSQRELQETDDQGHQHPVIEYYHRYVFAQINGPKCNVLLDVEPIGPGAGEAEAALRLLGRLRRLYGVRFFDALTVDSWYVQGPFLKAVEKLGWGWVVVLKQERMEVLQEARALTAGQKPQQQFYDEERQRDVQLWEVHDLNFSASYGRKVRAVHTHEEWTEKKVVGGKKTSQRQTSDWWWMASEKLQAYPGTVIYAGGCVFRALSDSDSDFCRTAFQSLPDTVPILVGQGSGLMSDSFWASSEWCPTGSEGCLRGPGIVSACGWKSRTGKSGATRAELSWWPLDSVESGKALNGTNKINHASHCRDSSA